MRPRNEREPDLSDPVLAAFIVGDADALRELLGIEAWVDTPLTGAACPAPVHGEAHGRCRCATLRLRAQITAEIEHRGGITWAHLDDPDDEVARLAWGKLAVVAESCGVGEEQWGAVLRAAGWEGWWIPDPEDEANDAGA